MTMIEAIRMLWRRVWYGALVVGVWLAPAAAVWAQRRRKPVEPPKEPSYAFEYGVVIFVILLGLAVVFRPIRRTELEDEIKLPFGPKQ
jgi:hypothetical protein